VTVIVFISPAIVVLSLIDFTYHFGDAPKTDPPSRTVEIIGVPVAEIEAVTGTCEEALFVIVKASTQSLLFTIFWFAVKVSVPVVLVHDPLDVCPPAVNFEAHGPLITCWLSSAVCVPVKPEIIIEFPDDSCTLGFKVTVSVFDAPGDVEFSEIDLVVHLFPPAPRMGRLSG
jgi:hypothetical protein